MRRHRLATALATLPLAAVACGTATDSTGSGGTDHGSPSPPHDPPTAAEPTPHSFAAGLLKRVEVPNGAQASAHSPTKALDRLPVQPGMDKPPVVVTKFWTVDLPAKQVVEWLRAHAPSGVRFDSSGDSGGTGEASSTYLSYRSPTLPDSIAVGDLYLAVVADGSSHSAIGAYGLSLAQPPRPAAENVPTDARVVIHWSLALEGTPARKDLTGPAAQRLARDFNALRVDTSPYTPCPMIPRAGGDVVVTFSGGGHTWKVDVPACPDISVQRDGKTLPPLSFGAAFMDDLKQYVGVLPQPGPPRADRVIPLVQHYPGPALSPVQP